MSTQITPPADGNPRCPGCRKEIGAIKISEMEMSDNEIVVFYCCPKCNVVIHMTHAYKNIPQFKKDDKAKIVTLN